MRIEAFKPEHMAALLPRLNLEQTLGSGEQTRQLAENLAENADVFTAFDEDGNVLCIAGAMVLWRGRNHLFAYMANDAGPHMFGIHKAVKRYLNTVHGRLEAQVSEGFAAGRKWMEKLGFQNETPDGMARFFGDERRGFMYAKVNG